MSFRWLVRCALLMSVVGLASSLAWQTGVAGPVPRVAIADDVASAVQSGMELERSRKWLDAIEHYEKASKAWPKTQELEYGLRRARIHFGIERRYTDHSFTRPLPTMSRTEAFALFDEVLNTVQSHYLEPVEDIYFVAHGTESFYRALSDERYVQTNVQSQRRGQVNSVRTVLKDRYWNKPVANRHEAHATLGEICNMAETQLGMKPAPVVMEYIFGGCNVLDDYSGYLTPSRFSDLHGNIEGEFVGLGIEMKAEPGKGLLLVSVLPESPAAEGGLLAGEHIVSVDGHDCRNMTTDEAAGLLQGQSGSRVTVDVQRTPEDRARRLSLSRRAVVVKSIPIIKMVDHESGVGYIQMNSFQKSSATELDAALQQLRQQGMRALIWDVRGNPGGLLTAAVEVSDRFINSGVVVSTRGRAAMENRTYNAQRPGTWNMPLVLLVDGDSASASEIVAGAVRDHQRGQIVGRKTYGKWSVQSIYPISGSAGLRLTTAKFYSPSGQTYGKVGIHPDVEVPEPDKKRTYFRAPTDFDADSDQDVQKGIEILRRQIAAR